MLALKGARRTAAGSKAEGTATTDFLIGKSKDSEKCVPESQGLICDQITQTGKDNITIFRPGFPRSRNQVCAAKVRMKCGPKYCNFNGLKKWYCERKDNECKKHKDWSSCKPYGWW